NAVYDGLLDNPAYAALPITMGDFKSAIDDYTKGVAAALDGGKAAIAERQKCRNDVIAMFRALGHYVERACNNDINAFISSGFVAATPHQRSSEQPLAAPSTVIIEQGVTGQFLVTPGRVPKARSYVIRFAPTVAAGSPVNWATIAVVTTRP